jgi:hypothetical protein
MKKGYLHDPDTVTSYYPFSLCLMAPSSAATSRTLVVIWRATAVASKLFKKTKIDVNFYQCEMDANLIRVAPECQDTGGLDRLYRGTFGRWTYFQK